MSTPPLTTIGGTATHFLKSASLPDELQIDIGLPDGYEETDQNYPVVYLTDSYWFFPAVTSAARWLARGKEAPPLIIVGIGYKPIGLSRSEEEERPGFVRQRDLTPTRDPSEWWNRGPGGKAPPPEIENGHADRFLDVIERDVKPLVYQNYRADRDDETLAGFSLGGLFTMYSFFRHSEKYDRFLVGSPSLWWHDDVMFEIERDFAGKNKDIDKALFLSMGSLEEPELYAYAKMVTNLKRMSEQLKARNYPSLKWESMILQDESHTSGIASTFGRGLQSLFRLKAARSHS